MPPPTALDHIVAVAGLVDRDGRVLLAQRPEGKFMAGAWELPGGKIEPHESPQQALIRELNEELAIDVTLSCLAPLSFNTYQWPHASVLILLYVCRKWNGIPTPQENQSLKWCFPNQWNSLALLVANTPLMGALRDLLLIANDVTDPINHSIMELS